MVRSARHKPASSWPARIPAGGILAWCWALCSDFLPHCTLRVLWWCKNGWDWGCVNPVNPLQSSGLFTLLFLFLLSFVFFSCTTGFQNVPRPTAAASGDLLEMCIPGSTHTSQNGISGGSSSVFHKPSRWFWCLPKTYRHPVLCFIADLWFYRVNMGNK